MMTASASRRTQTISTLALLMCLVGTGVAAADGIDDFITAQLKRQNIPGLALAVIKDGKIVKTGGYGVSDVAQKIPVTPETVFHIGSISKPFVALGVMRLVQEGRLGLDASVRTYLDGAPDTWTPITVRHLLTHTSGLVRDAPGFEPTKNQNNADVIRTAYPLPLRFAPGEKWEYCNTGYAVLGEIIRKVSGRPWHEYLRDVIFKPAGMNATY